MRPKIILFSGLVFLLACNKKDIPKGDLVGSRVVRSHFTDSLTHSGVTGGELFVARAIQNTADYFYVIQKNGGTSYTVFKSNLEAKLLYTKEITLESELLVDVEGSKNSGDFYTLTATNNFNNNPQNVTQAYAYKELRNDSSKCSGELDASNYEFDPSFNVFSGQASQNHSQLKKFNGSGNLVWSKDLDGNFFTGNAIETDAEGNTYVLTASRQPASVKIMPFSGLVPYYNLKQDSNSVSLYKFNNKGVQLFKKTIGHMSSDYFAMFSPGLALAHDFIYVKSKNHLFTFDLNGSAVSSAKPLVNACYNELRSVISNVKSSVALVTGILHYTPVSRNIYYLKLNGKSALSTENNSLVPLTISAMDSFQNFYNVESSVLTKMEPSGQVLYRKILYTATGLFGISEHSFAIDSYNDFYCFFTQNGTITLYKFDKEGNYN